MKPVPPASAFERPAQVGGGILLLACLLAAIAWPGAAAPALRLAAIICLQPALGCLVFLLIHHLTGGQWGEALSPMLRAGTRLVPWIWPGLGLVSIWHWSRPDLPLMPDSRPLPSLTMVGGRAVLYECLLIAICRIALRPGREKYAGPALLAVVFGGHCLAADTFFVLEPGWYSSAFPLVWLAISAAAGFALALACSISGGLRVDQPESPGRTIGLDEGNLLLTAVIFSTYVAFMEFLIIWAGNLPREISWFHRRAQGGWAVVVVVLALAHLAFPFVFLLSRGVKRNRDRLRGVALLVCGADTLWAVWFVMPPFADRGPWLAPLCAFGCLGAGSVFFTRYLQLCREGAGT